jgi:hypothetical protein
MAPRLGQGLYWAACAISAIIATLGLIVGAVDPDKSSIVYGILPALAVVTWLFGSACRYVLAGPRPPSTFRRVSAGVAVVVAAALLTVSHIVRRDADPNTVGLQGEQKEKFVAAFADSCMKTQSKLPENVSVPPGQLQNYCGCAGSGLADSVSMAEINQYPPDEAIIKSKLSPIADKCQATIFAEAPPS